MALKRSTDIAMAVVISTIACAVFMLNLYRYWAFTVDDAYITLRFARNIASGHGFVYNVGGPAVEGYSNPLLLAWQVAIIAFGGDGLLWTKLLGACAGVAAMAGSALIVFNLLRGISDVPSRACSALAPLLLCNSLALVSGSVSGLETSLFAASIVWCGYLFLLLAGEQASRGTAIAGGFLFGLLPWIRPEGIAWTAGFSLALIVLKYWRKENVRSAWLAFAAALLAWLILISFRVMEFGYWQPNTYYAKLSGSAMQRAANGLSYYGDWFGAGFGWLWLLLSLAGVLLLHRSKRVRAGILLAAIICHSAIVIYTGGDWMPHLRFVAPMLPLLASLATAGVVVILVRVIPSRPGIHLLASAMIVVLVAFLSSLDNERGRLEIRTRVFGWNDGHKPLGEWLGQWQQSRGERLTVMIEDIGLVGWYGDVDIIDLAGLVDPEWAHIQHDAHGNATYPAREFLARDKPEAVVLVGTLAPEEDNWHITWTINAHVMEEPLFQRNYTYFTTFTHKAFPHDGYYLHVFLRNSLETAAPPANPPVPRAR